MKRKGILNTEIVTLISELRHGHSIMVTDAGFPTPYNAKVIDLAIVKNVPTIEFVLNLMDSEMVTEKIIFAKELRTNNPSLYKKVLDIYTDADKEEVMHTDLISKYSKDIKCFIHTGEYSPWGNIIIVAGTDPYLWFEDETTLIPEFYHKRFKQIKESGKENMFQKDGFKRKDY